MEKQELFEKMVQICIDNDLRFDFEYSYDNGVKIEISPNGGDPVLTLHAGMNSYILTSRAGGSECSELASLLTQLGNTIFKY